MECGPFWWVHTTFWDSHPKGVEPFKTLGHPKRVHKSAKHACCDVVVATVMIVATRRVGVTRRFLRLRSETKKNVSAIQKTRGKRENLPGVVMTLWREAARGEHC